MMKMNMFLFIIAIVCILSGCSKKNQMTDFIPTQAPEVNSDAITDNSDDAAAQEEITVTPTPKPIIVGQTTKKYVQLDEYGGTLNVRQTPSATGTKVGFLVHAEEVDVINIADGWASFLYNGAICYVNADFLVDQQPAFLEPPTPTPKPSITPTPKPEAAPNI